MKRLMLLSCSSCKNDAPGQLPAIDRYTGVVYRSIKKARRQGYWPGDTDIYIISAKYGLIPENALIDTYDQKMNKARARELQQIVSGGLDLLLKEGTYQQIFINLGQVYLQSISLSSEIKKARQVGIVQEAVGGIGVRLKQTKEWIKEQVPC